MRERIVFNRVTKCDSANLIEATSFGRNWEQSAGALCARDVSGASALQAPSYTVLMYHCPAFAIVFLFRAINLFHSSRSAVYLSWGYFAPFIFFPAGG